MSRREVDPDSIAERTREVSRRDLKMLDDKPREEAREVADVGEGVKDLLGD